MADEPKHTSAARRLYNLVMAAKVAETAQNVAGGLQKMFNLSSYDQPKVFIKFAAFLSLIATVERRCLAVQNDPKAKQFVNATSVVRRAFQPFSPEMPWVNVLAKISESDVALLFLAAEYFDDFKEELAIDAQELQKISETVDEMIAEVQSANLDEHLKILILDQLDTIRSAIADYSIRGAEGLKKALAESVGMMILEKPQIEKNKENPTVTKFFTLLTRINSLVQMVMTAHKLGNAVGDFIQNLPN